MLHLTLHHVADFEKISRPLSPVHGAASATRNDIPWLQGHLTKEGHQRPHPKYHFSEIRVLLHLAVHAASESKALGVGHFIRRNEIGAQRIRRVQIFGQENTSQCLAPLNVTGRNVVVNRVAHDDVESVIGLHVLTVGADHVAHLGFPFQLFGLVWVDHGLHVPNQGGGKPPSGLDVLRLVVSRLFQVAVKVNSRMEELAGPWDGGPQPHEICVLGNQFPGRALGFPAFCDGFFRKVQCRLGGVHRKRAPLKELRHIPGNAGVGHRVGTPLPLRRQVSRVSKP